MKPRFIKSIGLLIGLAVLMSAVATASASATVVTKDATEVTTTSAVLNGTLNAEGKETLCKFEYGPTTSYGFEKFLGVYNEVGDQAVAGKIVGSFEGATIHFRLACTFATGTVYGADKSFTGPKVPTATTNAATNIYGTEATLNGTVNPQGGATTYWFQYGTTTSYGKTIPIPAKEIGSGFSNVAVSQTPAGLSRETTYHFRVVAQNVAGTKYGSDATFKTVSRPKVTTKAATEVNPASGTAKLNGEVNPEGLPTTWWFEYGTTTGYGTKVPIPAKEINSPWALWFEVNGTATGLVPGNTYHYRLVAQNSAGITYGTDLQIVLPKVVTGAATGITSTAATLNATVDAAGSELNCGFNWGPTTSYGSSKSYEPAVTGTTDTPISVNATGLTPNTTYHYVAYCINWALGIGATGEDKTFKTAP